MNGLTRLATAAAVGAGTVVFVGVGTAVPASAAGDQCSDKTVYIKNRQAITNLERTGFTDSWRFATGKGVVVAVVDSGVDAGNLHFKGALLPGKSFIGGAPTQDVEAHGTAIAGIIAARPLKNGSVLVGSAPSARILPVRVYESRENASTSAVAEGIRYAAEQGADVINVSISTGASDGALPKLRSAVAFAVSKGAVIVAPAGNRPDDEQPFTQVQFPADFDGVVGVAATNANGVVDNYTIHGRHVDVAAPGAQVLTTFRAKGDCLVGLNQPYSSYATAYVSGLAAQLRQRFPQDSAAQIINRLTSSADRPRKHTRDDVSGWGFIQPVAALTTSTNTSPRLLTDAEKQPPAKNLVATVGVDDPLASSRDRLLWWGLAMTALLAVALVARPLARSRRKS